MSASVNSATLLIQLQLTDSAFPSGLYTLSHGLEGFTQDGQAADLPALLGDLLEFSAGPADASALALAHAATRRGDWAMVAELDERLHAVKLSREVRAASARTGKQVLDTARRVFGIPESTRLAELVAAKATPGNHAVVMGVLYAGLGVTAANAVAGDLYAYAASFTGAAVRLGKLDFRQAQAVLYGAGPSIGRATATAMAAGGPRDVHGSAFLADIGSARHERAAARMFTT